jgi:quercetin dioxygenase-like cupin family protein
MHSHPNHVIYALTDGSFKITTPDGKSVNVDLKAGQAIWMQAGQHDVGNTGKAEAHNLAIELKK